VALPAFLSYSHRDRDLAGLVKGTLDSYGLDTFLAHEDLKPSVEWQKTILLKLRECKVFLPLLTNAFKESNWTDQETGIALARNKIIVPLKVDCDPYGFIGRYQAQSLADVYTEGVFDVAVINERCWSALKVLSLNPKIGDAVKDGIIMAFAASGSFNSSAYHAKQLAEIEPFTDEQLSEIVRESGRNSQIYGGFAARDYVNALIDRNRNRLASALVSQFRRLSS